MYREKIGTFQPKSFRKPCIIRAPGTYISMAPFYLIILLTSYCSLIVHANVNHSKTFLNYSPGMKSYLPPEERSIIEIVQWHTWDPGITSIVVSTMEGQCSRQFSEISDHISVIYPWEDHKQRNKLTHILNGNRERRGRGINCVYWNKGPSFLVNKLTDIKCIVEEHKPHILGLGEANVRQDHALEDLHIEGYLLYLDSAINTQIGMARVAVYTHTSLRVQRRPDLEDDTIPAVWLECGLPGQQRILVCIGYRQWQLLGQQDNSSGSVSAQLGRWLTFLNKWESAINEGEEVIVAINANLDHLSWRSENLPPYHISVKLRPLTDALFDKILPLGVSQLVAGATHLTRGQARSGLDHLYSNKPDKLSSVQTYITGLSDHKLIKVIRFAKSFRQNPRYIRKRTFKNFDTEQFLENLENSNLEEVLACNDDNDATELLEYKISRVLDDMAPIKTIQTRTNYVPWLSEDAKKIQKEKIDAQKKAAITDNSDDWRQFRALRNQFTSKSRSDKEAWEKEKLNDKQNSSTDIWKVVRGWLGWGSGGTPTQLHSEGKLVTSPAGIATTMNKFFLEKINRLRSSIPSSVRDPLRKMKEAMKNRSCTFKIQMVTVSNVVKTINSLKNSSATGVDFIDTRTVKLAANLIAPMLTHIINLSISTGTFPTRWKYAKVVPLLKAQTADPLLPKSYRPVALLPILSKVLEMTVFTQFISYLEANSLVHPNLHGSRAAHSTTTALIQLYDKWADEVEKDKMVGVLICDQSAAFDLCDHNLLVQKLRLLGMEDSAADWVWSYLSGRKQSCQVDGKLSSPLDIPSCGVPQGSIGGPLLWLCFTCDQPDAVHEHPVDGLDPQRGCVDVIPADVQVPGGPGDCGELVGYVDDGAYSYAHPDPVILSRVLTRKFQLLENWVSDNKLVINPDKTHLLVLGPKKIENKRKEVEIQAGPYTIKPTDTEKLLGAHLHESMQCNNHIRDHSSSIMKQLNTRINGLKKIARTATFRTRLMIANGAVMSKLVYLITVWGGAQEYLLTVLQVQQLTAARAVCGLYSRFWSKRKLLSRVGWLSVRQLIYFHTVLQVHKTIKSGKPASLYNAFSTEYPYRTRNAEMGRIRFGENFHCRSRLSFKNRAVLDYNRIPAEVLRGAVTVKLKLRHWVKQNIPIDRG